MALSKLARLMFLCCALLLPIASLAQGSHYTTASPSVGMSDGTADCLLAGHQCWIPISTAPTLSQISVGVDGSVYALDASGNIWFLPLHSHTWQSTALSPMAELSVVSSKNIYGLQVATSFCGLPEMQIYQYTGGADFARFNYCAVHIGAAPDGTLYRIRSSGNVTHLVNGSWISDPTAGGNGTPAKIVAGSASNVWLITSTGIIKTLNSSGSFVVVPGTATDITTAGDPSNGQQPNTLIVGAMANSNNVYTYGYAQGNWNELIGVLDKISAGGQPFFTMGIRQSLHTVYHLNNTKIGVSSSTTGYYDCNVFPNGCPAGSTHTATVNIHFTSGGHPGSGSSVGTPAQTLDALGTAFTEDCDPVFGNPSDPECQSTTDGAVICSVMGAIFAQTLGSGTSVPIISGSNTVWWFNGQDPASSTYPTSVTLSSTGGASTSWAVTQSDSKVSLSATTGAQITVSSTGTKFSGQVGDISITATANGLASSPFTMTAKTPWKLQLQPGSPQTFCNPSPQTYGTEINYDLLDNLSGTMGSDVNWNESVQAAVCENGSNWCNYAIVTSGGSTNPLTDDLAPPKLNVSPAPQPTPSCNGQGTTRYRSIPQVIYAGSDSSGGVQVQSDKLGYYGNHGQHDSIQIPARPPQ